MFLELEDGMVFSYSGDWSALGRNTGWNGTWRLQGSKGSLHLDQDKVSLARCARWGKDPLVMEIAVPDLVRLGQAQTLHDFAQAIRTGVPAETGGAANLNSFFAVSAAMRSVREARRIALGELAVP